jgi:hypothetical protein
MLLHRLPVHLALRDLPLILHLYRSVCGGTIREMDIYTTS